jgi:hypothetical protein
MPLSSDYRLFLVDALLASLFDPEDGRNKLLRNVGGLCPDYTALHIKRKFSYSPL